MKKIVSLCVLMFLAYVMNGQIIQYGNNRAVIQVGSFSDNSYSSSPQMPIRRANKHSYVKSVYNISQYSLSGYIDTLWFYCTTLGDNNTIMDTSVRIYMAHIPYDSYSGNGVGGSGSLDGFSLVYKSDEIRASVANQWMPIALDTPFYYNALSQLQVMIYHDNDTALSVSDNYAKVTTQTYGVTYNCGGSIEDLQYEPRYGIQERPLARFSIEVSNCNEVADFTVSYSGGDSVSLSWVDNQDVSQWQVKYVSDDESHSGSFFVNDINGCVVSGLWTNHTYYFSVRSVCGAGDTGHYVPYRSAHIITCPSPDSLIVVDKTERSIRLGWRENGGATLWEIMVEDDSGVIVSDVFTNQNTYNITGLEPRTYYTMKVRSICRDGDSSFWSEPLVRRTLTREFLEKNVMIGCDDGNYANLPYTAAAPFFNEYKHTWVQMIYPIDTVDLVGIIDTIWWHCKQSPGVIYDTNVTIFMGHTSNSVHLSNNSWLMPNELQQVYHSSQAQPSTTGLFPIVLDTPFYYNGTENLVIAVSYHASYFSFDYDQGLYSYVQRTGSVLSRWSDNDYSCGLHPGNSTGSIIYQLLVLRFSITMDLSSLSPISIDVDSVTNTEAYVHITDSTQCDMHLYAISKTPNITESIDTIVTSLESCVFTNLEEGTTYYIWACNSNMIERERYFSTWTGPTSFTTSIKSYYAVNVYSSDSEIGDVEVTLLSGTMDMQNGGYEEGSLLELKALPLNETSFFEEWDDGDAENPRYVTINKDTTFVANFNTYEGIEDVVCSGIVVEPNPASQWIRISAKREMQTIVCCDVAGHIVSRLNPGSNSCIVDVSKWLSGLYYIVVKTGYVSKTFKVVVCK